MDLGQKYFKATGLEADLRGKRLEAISRLHHDNLDEKSKGQNQISNSKYKEEKPK